MGFFRSLFGKSSRQVAPIAATTSAPSPGSIGYDPKLVELLLSHHAQLGAMYQQLAVEARAGNSEAVRSLLTGFKTSLQSHVLTENVRFYSYLEKSLSGDSENAATMREFRREMNDIARQVVEFTGKWLEADVSSPTARDQFLADHTAVGKRLEQRLNNEETSLYPLYHATQ